MMIQEMDLMTLDGECECESFPPDWNRQLESSAT